MYDIKGTGRRLRELRKQAGKTQEQVAVDIGLGVRTYRSIEQGQRGTSVDTLLLLAEYFKVSMDFLVKGGDAASSLCHCLSVLDVKKQEMMMCIIKAIIRTLEW